MRVVLNLPMSQSFSIAPADLIQQLKLSLQVPEVVQAFARRSIIATRAEQLGIHIEATELQTEADAFRLNHELTTAAETLSWLQKHQLSVDDFEDLIYADLLAIKLAQQLFGAQIEPYFLEHQAEYVKVSLYEIVLADGDLAIELFYTLQEQELPFEEVVRRYATDERSRQRRGYRGMICPAELPPKLAEAVFAVQPPQILQPIQLGTQFHLMLVEERIEPELDETMQKRILHDLFSGWLQEQIAISEVQYEF